MSACWKILISLLLALSVASAADAQVPTKHVLAIGIDGMRPDALAAASTPNLDALIANGSFTDTAKILGSRYRENNTISGPGWSSILTGVWADKHGVEDNEFSDPKLAKYPHFFALLKQQFPDARTGSFVDWEPIETYIVTDADVHQAFPSHGADEYAENDRAVTKAAVEFLSDGDPHATMVYLGVVDETGHRDGFHPSVRSYLQAIEQVDGHIGELIAAIKNRPNYVSEDWLVLVTSDHGGQGTGHGGGHQVPEILNVAMIVSGASAQRGRLTSPAYLVDYPVTALAHLGVEIDPAWELDGRPVGLAVEPATKYLIIHADDAGMSHSVNLATIDGMENGTVSSASIMVPCPWLLEFAEYCREHPDGDYGIHLTLNAEWEHYRWGPVAPREQVPSLVDPDGYLWDNVRQVVQNVKAEEVAIELRAQVERAKQFGIPLSHLDTHMGAVVSRPDLIEVYVDLAIEFDLPVLYTRERSIGMSARDPSLVRKRQELEKKLEAHGLPIIDRLAQFYDGDDPAARRERYINFLRNLQPGITELIIHCGYDNLELSAITSSASRREADLKVFTDPAITELMRQENIQIITWRDVRKMAAKD